MTDFTDRYFQDEHEYGDPVAVMMECGVLLSYVSSTYLSGWVNYVEIQAAFLVTRYEPHSQNVEEAAAFNAPMTNSGRFHTKVSSDLHDDVAILARATHRRDEWWFFYCDQDVSDCAIGRFVTDDPPERVMALFHAHVEEGRKEPRLVTRLEPRAFTGWVTI